MDERLAEVKIWILDGLATWYFFLFIKRERTILTKKKKKKWVYCMIYSYVCIGFCAWACTSVKKKINN